MVGDFSPILNLVGDRSPMTPMVVKPMHLWELSAAHKGHGTTASVVQGLRISLLGLTLWDVPVSLASVSPGSGSWLHALRQPRAKTRKQ